MDVFIYLLLAVVGLIIGSFLTAYTYRIPREEDIAKDRSRCPKCKKKISWYDNIPLLSYILLGGKCRQCGKKISARYPAIEFVTALGFVLIYYLTSNCGFRPFGLLINSSPLCTWGTMLGVFTVPFFVTVYSILVAIFVIDWEHQIIPDKLIFVLYSLVAVALILTNPENLWTYFFVGFATALFLLLINLLTKGKGMGLGDVKFALAGGTLLGWPAVLTWMFVSFVSGAAIGLLLIAFGKASFGRNIAFGPFLVIGLIAALVLPITYYAIF